MARDRQLLAQRGDLHLVAGQLGLHRGDVKPRAAAQLEGLGRQVEVGLVAADDVLGGGDLRLQAGDGDRLAHHLGGQGQIGGVGLIALGLRLGQQPLALAAALAEQVEIVAAAQPEGIVGEGRIAEADGLAAGQGELREAEGGEVDPGFRHRGVGVDGRAGGLGLDGVTGLGERLPGGLEVVVPGHGGADGLVDLRRMEQRPPIAGEPLAEGGLGRVLLAGHGVALGRRRGRRLEVRAHGGAAGQEGGPGSKAKEAAHLHGAYSMTGAAGPAAFGGGLMKNRIGIMQIITMVISQKSSI